MQDTVTHPFETMRILFVAPFGSCQKQTLQRRMLPLAAALAAPGHRLEVLIPAWDCPDEAGRVEQRQAVRLHYLALGRARVRMIDPVLWRNVIAAAAAFDPDIVHVFKPIGISGLAGDRLAARGFTTVVDLDDLETGRGWGAKRSWAGRLIVERQERRLLARAAGATVASRFLESHVQAYAAHPASLLYLPNGVIPAPEPLLVRLAGPQVLLLTRGNDVRAEDVSALWSGILAQAPAANLVIGGDWAQAPDLPRCRRLGWLAGDALDQVYRASAVAMFPALNSDRTRAKSPARLLDCLGVGLPVVTTAVGEYSELVGINSGLVARSQRQFVDLTAALLLDVERRQAAGRYCWQRAQRFHWRHLAAGLEQWYPTLLGERAAHA